MATTEHNTDAYLASLLTINKNALPPNGGERFNRLIFSHSPYLLQHAENPVDWYEWGETAFEKARTGNLPILLSIGYATCHWCHVMAHESFEDIDVANLLNHNYVCIKVDREERPDIDDFYMTVSQLMTGSGGWPLNIFMTPDKHPFMAFTYLPKTGNNRTSGFMDLLANIAVIWQQRPDKIENNCRSIMEALANSPNASSSAPADLMQLSESALQQLTRIYDETHGGFGNAPKFPMPIYLKWLIAHSTRKEDTAFRMVSHSLKRMRHGGIWDQLGGGLHRYSVDREWLTPHFEKMLYDQAMVAQVALDAYRLSHDPSFLEMAENIFQFVACELRSPEGGFFSALDADSSGIEGKYYVWDFTEIHEVLTNDAPLFIEFHAITEQGNFEGSNILSSPLDIGEFCRKHQCEPMQTVEVIERCQRLLLAARKQRIRPLRDEKIITAWNGLMISALAAGSCHLQDKSLRAQAESAARFLLNRLKAPSNRLMRSYMAGATTTPAFLEDYAFLATALLDLYEATLDEAWLKESESLATEMISLFRDAEDGSWLLVGKDAEQMPARVSSDHDGVTPSPTSTASLLLIRLSRIRDDSRLLTYADMALKASETRIAQNTLSQLGWLQAFETMHRDPIIATITGDPATRDVTDLLTVIAMIPRSGVVIRHRYSGEMPTVSLCANNVCHPPVSGHASLLRHLVSLGDVQQ